VKFLALFEQQKLSKVKHLHQVELEETDSSYGNSLIHSSRFIQRKVTVSLTWFNRTKGVSLSIYHT